MQANRLLKYSNSKLYFQKLPYGLARDYSCSEGSPCFAVVLSGVSCDPTAGSPEAIDIVRLASAVNTAIQPFGAGVGCPGS